MSSKSASLLTQTQRNRIRDEFADLTDEKTRRDQQRIRERIRSGILDFQLLADYPDRQFGLAFDDASDEELRAALADTYIVVERLRERHGIDREELIEEARTHTEGATDATDDLRTIEQIDLRTALEIRQQTEAEFMGRFGPGIWDKRANGLMKLGVGTFILIIFFTFVLSMFDDDLSLTPSDPLLGGLALLLFMTAMGWLLIKTVQSLKYTILPVMVKLIRSPDAVIRDVFVKVVKNPKETIRKSWNEL